MKKTVNLLLSLSISVLLFSPSSIFGQEDKEEPTREDGQLEQPQTPRIALGFVRGIFWQGQSVPGSVQGAETSPILGSLGISLRLPFSVHLGLNPSFDFFTDEYLFSEEVNRAVPTQIESASGLGPLALILGMGITIPLEITLPLSHAVELLFGPGLTGVFRIPLWGLDGSTQEEITVVGEDLNALGRWFFPELRLGTRVRINTNLDFIGSIRGLFPLWHAWDTREMPFYDTFLLWLNLGIEIRL